MVPISANASYRLFVCRVTGARVLRLLMPHPCPSVGMVPGIPVTYPLVPRAAVCPRPLQNSSRCPYLAAPSHNSATQLFPRAVVLPQPLQHVQVPANSGGRQVPTLHGRSCSRAHCNMPRCPPLAVYAHIH